MDPLELIKERGQVLYAYGMGQKDSQRDQKAEIRIRSKRRLVPWILNFKKNQAVLRCIKHVINQTKIK